MASFKLPTIALLLPSLVGSVLLRPNACGVIQLPLFPHFHFDIDRNDSDYEFDSDSDMSQQYQQVPSTPRVISPSPTPSESGDGGSYFAPITRSAAKRRSKGAGTISEERDSDSDLDMRARARSRSSETLLRRRRSSGAAEVKGKRKGVRKSDLLMTNGSIDPSHLSPQSAASTGFFRWRDFSRSPSPLGLIPIHRHWRSFVHRYEAPRKILHVSIGFFTLFLYNQGIQTDAIHPWLAALLVPITTVEFLRHRFDSFNRFYIRCLGALMRETEVKEKYNGVIFYLMGAWATLRFLPKDVAVMSVLLLAWCDTAASVGGRIWGRYTPRIRRGKSLAGSIAATVIGLATTIVFYGYSVPSHWGIEEDFMFRGTLSLPTAARKLLGLGIDQSSIGGWAALGVLSVWSGLVASASELVDLWGMDDNLTIPILSGAGLWGFLNVFG